MNDQHIFRSTIQGLHVLDMKFRSALCIDDLNGK